MRLIFRKIFRNTVFLSVAKIISAALSLFLIVLISRTFGLQGFGEYALIFVILELALFFMDAGHLEFCTREISIDRTLRQKYLGNSLTLKVLIALIVYLLMIFVVKIITNIPTVVNGVYVGGIALLFNSFIGCYFSIFRSHEIMQYEAYSIVIQKLITVTLSVIFIAKGFGIVSLVFAYLIAILISFILNSIIIYNNFFKIQLLFNLNIYKKILIGSMPFFLSSGIESLLQRICMIFLFIFSGVNAIGIFEAGYKIIDKLVVFPKFFAISVFPKFSRLAGNSKMKLNNLYRKSSYFSFFLTTTIVAIIIIFAKPIILILFGEEFWSSIFILQISAISGFFIFMNRVPHCFLNSVNKAKINVYISLLGVLCITIFSFLLIPKFDYYGAAVSMLISFVVIYITKIIYISLIFQTINNKKSIYSWVSHFFI